MEDMLLRAVPLCVCCRVWILSVDYFYTALEPDEIILCVVYFIFMMRYELVRIGLCTEDIQREVFKPSNVIPSELLL